MRVVFMGTPELAATVLAALVREHEVVAAYTRPDAVRGRGKALVPSPVKEAAGELGIDVLTPRTLRDEEAVRELAAFEPDAVCVAAYGCILPREALAIPKHGCVNVHASLLPRWRGAAPVERAILADDEATGVCIMRMEEGLDTGPFCVRRETSVAGKYALELTAELAGLGAEALLEALALIEDGEAVWTEQGEGATYADKIGKGELAGSPDDTVAGFTAKVRASSPSHPARIELAGRRVAVERASAAGEGVPALAPGGATFTAKRLFVGVSDGAVELTQVKPDGKKSMEARAFAAGIQGIKNATVKWGAA